MSDRRPHTPIYPLFLLSFWCHPLLAEPAHKGDPGSLAQLHDIVVAAPVAPWWPLAPGWYLLASLFTLLAGWGLWRILRRRRSRRYRGEALAELHALRDCSADAHEVVAGVLLLLKRTALVAYPRVKVASLTGAAWWRFLDRSGAKVRFSSGLGDLAESVVYAQRRVDKSSKHDLKRLYRAAERWIRRHRPLADQPLSRAAADDTRGSGD